MNTVDYYGRHVTDLRPEQTVRLPTVADAVTLAREVLALRGAIGREQAIAEGLRATIATLTRQRDEAVAVAREAIAMLNQWDESMSSYQQGTSDGTTAKDLAARLAAITGEGV